MEFFRRILLTVLALPLCTGAFAQGGVIGLEGSFLKPLQPRDTALIADQFVYGFVLRDVAEGTGLMLQDFSKGIRDSVEVVSPWKVDTLKTMKTGRGKGAKRIFDIQAGIVITSFDEGDYELPALAVRRVLPGDVVDTLVFNPQTLSVKGFQIDTTAYVIHDIKGQVRYPLTFKEILPWLLGFYALAILLILAVCLWTMRKKAAAGEIYNEPAYIVALRKLDRFRGDKYWAPEKQKIFYSGITDTLREYIEHRFGVDAVEMTTAEIFSELKGSRDIPEDIRDEVKALFEKADMVKFAKHTASDQDNASALPTAVRFVTSTYQTSQAGEEPDNVL